MSHEKPAKRPPEPPRESKLENKSMPKHDKDPRMNTAAYPAGTRPPTD